MSPPLLDSAATLAEKLLAPLGDRWHHTQAVADRARKLAGTVASADHDVLVAAAWLHDVGYAPQLAVTRFHPLDGARHLASQGFGGRLCALVAHHSGARFEAAERGLSEQLAQYVLEDSPVMDALITADLTTNPQGQPVSFEDRVAEILQRYEPGSDVHRAVTRARECLNVHVRRVERRLSGA